MTELRVEYDITARDMVAGSLANLLRSGALRRQARQKFAYGMFFLALAGGGLFMLPWGRLAPWRTPDEYGWPAFSALAFCVGWTLIVSARHHPTEVRKSLLKECKRPEHSRFLGSCTIDIRSDGLHVSFVTSSSVVFWWAVSGVDVSKKYAVIHAGFGALPIPRRAFPDEAAFDAFVHTVRAQMERHAADPPA